MPTTETYKLGSIATLITTPGAMASNALCKGTAFDNTAGAAGDGYTLCDLELVGTFAVAPTVGAITLWFLAAPDGTNFEDGDGLVSGGADVTPARPVDVVIPVRAVATAQRINRRAWLPWGLLTPLIKNDGTGQSLNAGATLKVRPVAYSGV